MSSEIEGDPVIVIAGGDDFAAVGTERGIGQRIAVGWPDDHQLTPGACAPDPRGAVGVGSHGLFSVGAERRGWRRGSERRECRRGSERRGKRCNQPGASRAPDLRRAATEREDLAAVRAERSSLRVTRRDMQAWMPEVRPAQPLALDPDPAGLAAAARTSLAALAEVTQARGRSTGGVQALDLRIATLPVDHGDPDQLIRDHSELWEQALTEAVPAFEFYFAQTLASLDRQSDSWRQQAIERLLPVIEQFAGSIGWQATWLQRLSTETGIDPRALQRSVPSPRQNRRRAHPDSKQRQARDVVEGTTARSLTSDPGEGIERALLAMLLKLVVVPVAASELLAPDDFENPVHRTILSHLLTWQETNNYDYQMFRETLPEEVRERADELYGRDVPLPDDGRVSVAVDFHLARLRHFRVQAQHARASQLLDDVDPADRSAAIARLAGLMAERRQLEHELDRLSRLAIQTGTALQPDQGTIDQDSGSL